MESGFLVFVNYDAEGNIVEALTGFNVIPDRQYDDFFYLEEEINVLEYVVEDRRLVQK